MKASAIEIKDVPAVQKRKARTAAVKSEPIASGPDGLIQLAINRDFSVEKLEKLIEMRNAEIDRNNKRAYDEHFAAMQAEFEPVKKSKEGDNGKYSYAPLDALQKQYGPIIARHGFSYRWSEESLPDGGLRVVLTVSGHGHSVSNHKDLPRYEPDTAASSGKHIMNVLQAEGTRSTYGQRYTFVSGFGLIVEDEDTDGTFEQGVQYGEQVKLLRESPALEALSANWKTILSGLSNDLPGKRFLYTIYEARKKELMK